MAEQDSPTQALAQAQGATARNALVVIAVVVTGAAVYWLSGILTPLALALFLMIMIDSFARVLRRPMRLRCRGTSAPQWLACAPWSS